MQINIRFPKTWWVRWLFSAIGFVWLAAIFDMLGFESFRIASTVTAILCILVIVCKGISPNED